MWWRETRNRPAGVRSCDLLRVDDERTVRPMTTRLLLVALMAAVLAGGERQQPPASPRFSTAAQVVLLDVTVRDRSGTAVDDLTAGDFEVLERSGSSDRDVPSAPGRSGRAVTAEPGTAGGTTDGVTA
jgi:hypothetical protein